MADPLKVAIIGKAPSSRGLAPFDNPSFEIWTLSNLVPAGEVPRFDRHFEIHPLDWFRKRKEQHGDIYYDWLCGVKPPWIDSHGGQSEGKPVYLTEPHADVPAGVAFPKDAIVEKFGTYFTNTVSWMIAFAIAEGAKTIHVYGVDMAQDEEYAHQRPSCEFFLGWAAALGIDIYIPPESDLLKACRLYWFDAEQEDLRAKWVARDKEIRTRLAREQQKAEEGAAAVHFMRGALDSQNYWKQWFM